MAAVTVVEAGRITICNCAHVFRTEYLDSHGSSDAGEQRWFRPAQDFLLVTRSSILHGTIRYSVLGNRFRGTKRVYPTTEVWVLSALTPAEVRGMLDVCVCSMLSGECRIQPTTMLSEAGAISLTGLHKVRQSAVQQKSVLGVGLWHYQMFIIRVEYRVQQPHRFVAMLCEAESFNQ